MPIELDPDPLGWIKSTKCHHAPPGAAAGCVDEVSCRRGPPRPHVAGAGGKGAVGCEWVGGHD